MAQEYPSSDLQFIAQMTCKIQRGDQIPRSEQDRLDDIARHGRSTGWRPEQPGMVLNSLTRVER